MREQNPLRNIEIGKEESSHGVRMNEAGVFVERPKLSDTYTEEQKASFYEFYRMPY
jgi:hypothetical protein